jgi:hypothetical protein
MTGQKREDFVMVKAVPYSMRYKDMTRKLRSWLRVSPRLSRPFSLDMSVRQRRIISVILGFHLVLLFWALSITLFTQARVFWEYVVALLLSLGFYHISQDIILSAYKTVPGKEEIKKRG